MRPRVAFPLRADVSSPIGRRANRLVSRSPRASTSDPSFPTTAVAGAEIQYENYVLSRGGTRIIRKILIANNGRASPRPAALSHAFHFRNRAAVATDPLLPDAPLPKLLTLATRANVDDVRRAR